MPTAFWGWCGLVGLVRRRRWSGARDSTRLVGRGRSGAWDSAWLAWAWSERLIESRWVEMKKHLAWKVEKLESSK